MKKITALFFLILFVPSAARAFNRSGFDAPEGFVGDPETGAYYVSNVNGAPLEKDGNGYLSKISANGNLVIQKFVGGKSGENALNAPKGLLVLGTELWTTDIDEVRVFEKKTGKPVRTIDLAPLNAKYLKDIVFANGRVYVSDLMGDQILKIDPADGYKATVFYRGGELGNPGALLYNPKSKGLMAAGFKSGQILEIDRHGRLHVLKKGLTEPTGLDCDGAGYVYAVSRDKGEIYRIPFFARGVMTVLQSGLTAPSDISYSARHKELLVTSATSNTVTTFFVPTEKNAGKFNFRRNKKV